MALRICLVTPFDWSQPHDVNEHVAGIAAALRARDHRVTVLAPSARASDLRTGRRVLQDGAEADFIAVGPAVPVSRRSRVGVTVGVRANLVLALAAGRFDVVHGVEPGLPSLSYLALREARSLTVATFLREERLAFPPARSRRERLLSRLDALLATNDRAAAAAALRFPGEYELIGEGVDLDVHRPAPKRELAVVEWRTSERAVARATLRTLAELPEWELVLLRSKPLAGRPYVPRQLQPRVTLKTARDGATRAGVFAKAAIFVSAPSGLRRLVLEASAAGAAIAAPPHAAEQPELAAAEFARLAEDDDYRSRRGDEARCAAEEETFGAVAARLDDLYTDLTRRRRPAWREHDPLADRDWILTDLHMHTSWSHDCSTEAAELVEHADAVGLGVIAVTDHNAFGGALEAAELSRDRDLVVIPGEEVKTDGEGEVIGLFLREEVPRGMSFADTVAAIKEQGGLVYVPHPFDRMHAIPKPRTLLRHLADIDVLEVYNARLLFDAYNDEALRFARKYGLTMGAGSDAHVLQGVGTGALRMRRFDGPEEFLISLRSAEILRRPKSLVYLQGLKWVAQAKERVR